MADTAPASRLIYKVALVALCLVVGWALFNPRDPDATPAAVTTPVEPTVVAATVGSTTTTVATPTSTVMPVPEAPPGPVEAEPILVAANTFAAGWLTPGTSEERTARLKDVTAPWFLSSVANIDDAMLPAGPAGDVTIVEANEFQAAVLVSLPAAGTAARIEMQSTAAGWRVNNLDEAAPE